MIIASAVRRQGDPGTPDHRVRMSIGYGTTVFYQGLTLEKKGR